jgi:DNA-binding PadR family transcriptional regulator
VHSTLDRLEQKGFVKSALGEATAIRGGKRKRIFTITALGKRVLKDAMDFRMSLWKQYPLLAGKLNFSW